MTSQTAHALSRATSFTPGNVVFCTDAAQLRATSYSNERSQSVGDDRPVFRQGGGGGRRCSSFDLADVRDARLWSYAIRLHLASVHLLISDGLERCLAQLSHDGRVVLLCSDGLDHHSCTT